MGDPKKRFDVKQGLKVNIVLKQDQRSGKLTQGIVKKLLTNSPTHPHGIKVMLTSGEVGRVQEILQ
ncbi:MAG: YwbE family protein [Arcobacteraceae bacterium]|nr:YwbE family protein [Arcobacteraceae bacterium]